MSINYKDRVFKLKNMKLVPDNYGMTIEVKMVSAHNLEGKFKENVKINEDTLDMLKNGWIIFNG